ncbi:MAG: DUF1698 domain-containing protein [Bacteroidia bacterium]
MKNIEIKNPSQELIELFSLKEWRQRIHLYDNIYTPGTRSEYEWDMCVMPTNLFGKSFIDVGSNDGMMSFLAEKKDAKSVTSVDLYTNKENTHLNMVNGWAINRINQVKKIKKSTISIKPCSIYDLHTLNEKFDTVYCGNVIAWLNNPVEALKQLASITKEQLIIREDISKIKGKPVLEYINNDDFTGCMFNGNQTFYKTILKSLGFKKIEIIPVDEYKIVERREQDFKKFTFKENYKVYKNPFSDELAFINNTKQMATASVRINNRYFFNMIGWISENEVEEFKVQMIPTNLIKKVIFEKKYRKNLLDNSMIFATK